MNHKLVLERHHYKTLHILFGQMGTPWADRNKAFSIAEAWGMDRAIAHVYTTERLGRIAGYVRQLEKEGYLSESEN